MAALVRTVSLIVAALGAFAAGTWIAAPRFATAAPAAEPTVHVTGDAEHLVVWKLDKDGKSVLEATKFELVWMPEYRVPEPAGAEPKPSPVVHPAGHYVFAYGYKPAPADLPRDAAPVYLAPPAPAAPAPPGAACGAGKCGK